MEFSLIAVIVVALFFDFTNGFHDTANAIATSVTTKAIPPRVAVVGAAILNFVGAFVSLKVAATVATGVVNSSAISLQVVLAGLMGAIIWNLITWRFGMPTSSSHSLIGGIAGSAVAAAGFSVIQWEGLEDKVLLPSFAAPFLGIIGAGIVMLILLRLTHRKFTERTSRVYRRLQLLSASLVAFTHGTNDAQKTMGVIALALLIAHPGQAFHVPIWVIVASASAMALGTLTGGWRIIHTLGNKIVKLEPAQGFAAETTTAGILWFTAHLGFPVSTTHTISGSILGAGAAKNHSAVQWKTVRSIVVAWLITIPCAGIIGAAMEFVFRAPGGIVLFFVFAAVATMSIVSLRYLQKSSWQQVRARLDIIRRNND